MGFLFIPAMRCRCCKLISFMLGFDGLYVRIYLILVSSFLILGCISYSLDSSCILCTAHSRIFSGYLLSFSLSIITFASLMKLSFSVHILLALTNYVDCKEWHFSVEVDGCFIIIIIETLMAGACSSKLFKKWCISYPLQATDQQDAAIVGILLLNHETVLLLLDHNNEVLCKSLLSQDIKL